MANITLKIDDDLLKEARKLAILHNTSINAIIARRLEEYVGSHINRTAIIQGMEQFYKRTRARVGERTWTRDELHER